MTKNYSPDGDTNRHPEKEMEQAQALESRRDETDIERQERLIREQSEDTNKDSNTDSGKTSTKSTSNSKSKSDK
ncbi:hypothetical protein P59_196 [Bacillus phage P59]|nr:hypothetical protein P59_196 [Bacillus phage P59]